MIKASSNGHVEVAGILVESRADLNEVKKYFDHKSCELILIYLIVFSIY